MIELPHGFDGLQALQHRHGSPLGTLGGLPFLVRGKSGENPLQLWPTGLHDEESGRSFGELKGQISLQIDELFQVDEGLGEAGPGLHRGIIAARRCSRGFEGLS